MKLIDTIRITDLLSTGGLFSKLYSYDQSLPESDQKFPWLTSDVALYLDKDYYLVHSGQKKINRSFERFMKLKEDGLIADDLLEIVKIVAYKYALKWNKLYDAITTDYKPLDNYNMEEKETPDITKTKTVNSNIETKTTDDIVDNDTYGFNSSSPVPSGKQTRNGTVTVSGDADDNVETDTESGTRTLERSGNIGVTTSQQMLQSEIDLRNNYNFTNQLMDDMDSEICLLVY